MNLPKYEFQREAIKWYGLAVFFVIADQLSKYWISASFEMEEVLPFTSFFHFTLRHNYGAAFSMFHDGSGWQRWFLGGLSALVSVALVVWIGKLDRVRRIEAIALGCVLGGAVGNLIDRALFGYVVDFIVFHYKNYAFPAFNIADSAITIGAGLLIFDTVILQPREKTQEGAL